MKRAHTISTVTFIFLAVCSSLSAQSRDMTDYLKGGIVTLYAQDPVARSFCFRDGEYGGIFQQYEVRNRCSDINFHSYTADAFSIGVEGARQGVIIDLGTADELQKKYGYDETVGKGQGYASLRFLEGKVLIALDRKAKTTQELKDGSFLFQKPAAGTETAPVKIGHIYVMRLTDRYEKDFDLMVKLLVIANTPNETVTFRWQIL